MKNPPLRFKQTSSKIPCLKSSANYIVSVIRFTRFFIHSTDDPTIAIEDSLVSAKAWHGARHLRVDGLGHRRILAYPSVVAAAIEFVTTNV
jgi:pimeloyl-ACP methyl ester carboxylesterase